jgi:Zn-dependent protease with chaperone function
MNMITVFSAYFSNMGTIIALALPLLALTVLFVIFRRTISPKLRSWNLGLMLVSSIFLWTFIAVSLILCFVFADTYEYQIAVGIRAVFGRALLIGIFAALPFSVLLREISPKLTLAKVKRLTMPGKELATAFDALRKRMEIPQAALRLSKSPAPISFAIHIDTPIVVMSESLLSLLKDDEVEAVMAHELAHIKNSDTTLKALVTAYKTVLPHDPIVRLVEAAFHREREMVADQTAAEVTKKPLSLASALLKIYEAFPKSKLPSLGTLSILGAGSTLLSRHPPIRHRISFLINLADIHHQ